MLRYLSQVDTQIPDFARFFSRFSTPDPFGETYSVNHRGA
jgi:hypothetical protein